MDFAEVLPKIKDQIGFTDGVVITGGEPTVHPNLMDMIKQIKELGLLVKLDTNGTNPKLLKELVSEKLVDYVAMDVKGSFEKYNEICGVNIDTKKIQESIEFLIGQNDIDYMFRTTLYPILDESDFQGMAELLKGTKTFQLQQFIPNDFSNSQKVVHLPYRPDQAEKFIQIIKPHVGEVLLRGF
ncbi:MAG: anaerobic ribonucleoside-triphosphate reductase activating protein [Firmicutes bacterium]|nr:anaerobic ribonucleoside-triphosphate reductase activating protein [Bacillota bacterium]